MKKIILVLLFAQAVILCLGACNLLVVHEEAATKVCKTHEIGSIGIKTCDSTAAHWEWGPK